MRFLWVAVLLCAASVAPVRAESSRLLQKGDLLRIQTPGATKLYRFEKFDSDTIYVYPQRSEEIQSLPADQVESMSVRVKRPAGKGALRGLIVGGGLGGLVGAVYAASTHEETECGQFSDLCDKTSLGLQVIGYVGLFGMGGMALGGMIGSAAPGSEWKSVSVPRKLSLRLDPVEGLMLNYILTF